ncbi:MAG: 2 protein [Bacteroidetes bacterium]|nr:2 protein [Bacteroidota bacterium]
MKREETLIPSTLEMWIGKKGPWHLFIIGLVTLAAQLLVLARKDILILEWRPTDLAAIALNFYRNGFDFLHPQILWGGNGPGYVEMEFPLVPYSIALLYSVLGVHDWVAMIVPIVCGIGLTFVVYSHAKRLFGPAAGFFAALFAATSPTWLDMSTGIWPDPPTIFCGAMGLYLLTRWIDNDTRMNFVMAAFWISLAILLKLTSLYLGLPVLFLFWVKYRNRWWQSPKVWMFAAFVLVPPVLWYFHAYRLFLEYHNTFGIIGSGYMKFGTVSILTDPSFHTHTLLRLVMYHLTALGFVSAVVASVHKAVKAVEYLFPVWFGAVLIYLVIAARGVTIGHYQYILPVVPPGAVLAGIGMVILSRKLDSGKRFQTPSTRKLTGVLLLAILVVNAISANQLYISRDTVFRALSLEKMKTGKAVAKLTAPGSLIIVVDADMDGVTPEHSMTPPDVFYFADRHGWYQSMGWLSTEKIEELKTQGARYLVVSANHVDVFRSSYARLYNTFSGRYQILMDGGDGIIYDLWHPLGSG